MFGVSFTEFSLILVVILIVVGPQKLPTMMRTLGEWIGRFRRMTTEMRAQSGIDDVLRQEGLTGGIRELRALVRGELSQIDRAMTVKPRPDRISAPDPYAEVLPFDVSREYPVEGPDAYGALGDDLFTSEPEDSPPAEPPDPEASAPAVPQRDP